MYFYNENGKHSRFLFLGMVSLIAEKLRNNDSEWFKKFTKVRQRVEEFLIENKSLIGIALQNMGKGQRIPKMKELFEFLVDETFDFKTPLSPEKAIAKLGLRGRILDVRAIQTSPKVSDETKSAVMVRTHIKAAVKFPSVRDCLTLGTLCLMTIRRKRQTMAPETATIFNRHIRIATIAETLYYDRNR